MTSQLTEMSYLKFGVYNAVNVISGRLHNLYTVDIRQG